MAVDLDLDRKLRTITVYNFVIALLLGIPAGTSGPSIIVAFGTVPAFISAILGIIGLGNGLRNPYIAVPFDSIMTAAYVGLIIPTWVMMADSRRATTGGVMLATYATVPVIINMLIHAYCVARHLPLTGFTSQTVCPSCQHQHEVHHKIFHAPSTLFARSTIPSTIYTPDDDDETIPRLSQDYDETTALRRPSSDIDGSTLWQGDGRQIDVKRDSGRQV